MILDILLGELDLQTVQLLLSILGVMLSTHLMQLAWHNPDEGGLGLRILRRANLALVALGMLWSASYAAEHGWEPWPPSLLILLCVDAMMLIRIVIIRRMSARGARVQPPWPRSDRRQAAPQRARRNTIDTA